MPINFFCREKANFALTFWKVSFVLQHSLELCQSDVLSLHVRFCQSKDMQVQKQEWIVMSDKLPEHFGLT